MTSPDSYAKPTENMTEEVEVLICGSGSAGVTAAAWLARCGIPCKILESSQGPLMAGKADGVQCRTVEMFESFGLSEDLLREAYHVLEVAFWTADSTGRLACMRRTADTERGLSHQPHVILNQARVNGLLIEGLRKWNGQSISYGFTVESVEVDSVLADDNDAHPVTVKARAEGREKTFRARYALGCDGAHSAVRRSLGFKMIGDSSDAVWGVMDVYPRTDFPDIRKKAVLQTPSGTLMIIPREGGSLVRFYIELPHGTIPKDVTLDRLQMAAQKIFYPYTMEFSETFWWSAYSIGQRLADRFSKDNRLFLTGDACHTHSPKAGQGMNTSLQDGYNIGWKLVHVLKGYAGPELLKTYNIEREKTAADLIDFDRELVGVLSSNEEDKAQKFSEYFVKSARYTAGLTATYGDSIITCKALSKQRFAVNIQVGMRFPSAQVVRFCDAKAMQLVRALPADGRWRIIIFAGNLEDLQNLERLRRIATYLDSEDGPVRFFTEPEADIDSYIEPLVVCSGSRLAIDQGDIPSYFWPVTGKWKMRDLHKMFFDEESYSSGHGKAYEQYGIDPAQGAIVIVRPDHYVSLVTDIDNYIAIGNFFKGFCLRRGSKKSNGHISM